MKQLTTIAILISILFSCPLLAQKGGSNSSSTNYKLISREVFGKNGQAITKSIQDEKFILFKLNKDKSARIVTRKNGSYKGTWNESGNSIKVEMIRKINHQTDKHVGTFVLKKFGDKLIMKRGNYDQLVYQKTTSTKSLGNAKETLTENSYFLRSVADSHKYLDVPGFSTQANGDNGVKLQLWDFEDEPDRKIKFIPVDGEPGWYYIELDFGKGKRYFDINGVWSKKKYVFKSQVTSKKDNGARLQLWNHSKSSDVQKYRLKSVSGHPDRFCIEVQYSGKFLDASGNNVHKNGCHLMQWQYHGKENQQWQLINTETGNCYRK